MKDKRAETMTAVARGSQATAPVLAVDMDDAWALCLRACAETVTKPHGTANVRWADAVVGGQPVGVYWHVVPGNAAQDVFAAVESARRDRAAHDYLVAVDAVEPSRWTLVARDLVRASAERLGVEAQPAHPFRERHDCYQHLRWQVGASTVTISFRVRRRWQFSDLLCALAERDWAMLGRMGEDGLLLTQEEYADLLASEPDLRDRIAQTAPDAETAVAALRALDALVDICATSTDGAPLSGLAADVERVAFVRQQACRETADDAALAATIAPLRTAASITAVREASALVETLAEAGLQRAAAAAMDVRRVWRWRLRS